MNSPLLENLYRLFNKIKLIIDGASAKSMDVYTMEVSCCHAIRVIADSAIKELNENAKTSHYIESIDKES